MKDLFLSLHSPDDIGVCNSALRHLFETPILSPLPIDIAHRYIRDFVWEQIIYPRQGENFLINASYSLPNSPVFTVLSSTAYGFRETGLAIYNNVKLNAIHLWEHKDEERYYRLLNENDNSPNYLTFGVKRI